VLACRDLLSDHTGLIFAAVSLPCSRERYGTFGALMPCSLLWAQPRWIIGACGLALALGGALAPLAYQAAASASELRSEFGAIGSAAAVWGGYASTVAFEGRRVRYSSSTLPAL